MMYYIEKMEVAMITIHPEYVVDNTKKPKAIVLPLPEWEKVVEELEELDDIRAYDQAKKSSKEKLPFAQAVREIQTGCDA